MGTKLQSFTHPYSIFVPGLAGIPYSEEAKSPSIVRKAAARGDANTVFRNILLLLKNDNEVHNGWDSFIAQFHAIYPNIDIELEFNPDSDETISAYVIQNKIKLPIDSAGTGVLQTIQILSYENLYKPKLLILDEPDAHLNPTNQRKLAKLLKTLADDNSHQIIISTHSRYIAEELKNSSKLFWVKNGSLVDETDCDMISAFMDCGALDRDKILDNVKCVVLTEDSTDLEMFKLYWKVQALH